MASLVNQILWLTGVPIPGWRWMGARISEWRFEVVTKRSQSVGDDWGQTEAIRRHLKQKIRLFADCFASARLCHSVDYLAEKPYKSRYLAEREGFEPSLGYYPKHAFQAGYLSGCIACNSNGCIENCW